MFFNEAIFYEYFKNSKNNKGTTYLLLSKQHC